MKKFWIGILLLALGIGVGIGMIVMIIDDGSAFLAALLLFLAGILLYCGWLCTTMAISELKESLAKEKEAGEKTTKQQITKHVSVSVAACLLVLGLVICVNAFQRGAQLNDYVSYSLEKNKESDYDIGYLKEIEERVEKESSFVKKMFFQYADEIQERKDTYNRAVGTRAKEIMQGIAALEKCTKIESDDHYLELLSSVSKLKVNSLTEFETDVRQQVSNYDDLLEYETNLETLRATYCHKCEECHGSGGFTCSRCHGSGGTSCSSCGGSGKKLVTWYEHGDWGDTSYSSYTCKSCNGRGRSSCSSCSGGKRDCSACDGGNIYIYEDGKKS